MPTGDRRAGRTPRPARPGRAGGHPPGGGRAARERGAVYVLILLLLIIMGIAAGAAAPVWRTEIQRDKEEELIFRLSEYRRALLQYRTDRGKPPRELKDLLEDRTQLLTRRYLRRLYPDPMTGKLDWILEQVADQTGAVLGIADIHSRSTKESIRQIKGKKTYKDW